ncbi:MAG: L-serine ammonia-lyase [Bergeyella sp.]|nr:L-serine ammonia-lyase [Bergeyella sp.]
MKSISVFEIIKIGIGPSSSHTMGPWNAAQLFLNSLEQKKLLKEVKEISMEFFGSLSKTGIGHGTDIAAMLGMSGENYRTIKTHTIKEKIERIKNSKILWLGGYFPVPFDYDVHLKMNKKKSLDFHPNGMIFKAILKNDKEISQDYYSIGGGFVSIREEISVKNLCVRTLYPCHSGKDILHYCSRLRLDRVSDLVLLNEKSWRNREEIDREANTIWKQILECVYQGVNSRGVLPGGLKVNKRAHLLNEKLLRGKLYNSIEEWQAHVANSERDFSSINKWVSCFALAVNEENASFGRIITAPTNGASGVIPAVLLYSQFFTEFSGKAAILRFLLVAGEIGTLFKKNATISAAMGGCQAEIGVSSAMAAAGLTEIMGGSPEQVLMAAEIAMEHHLGLTCDPIAGLVQIPCIERNSMGAIKAITAAHMAIEGDPSKARVSLDEVILSMWETAQNMNERYKETSEGGLAISVNVAEC